MHPMLRLRCQAILPNRVGSWKIYKLEGRLVYWRMGGASYLTVTKAIVLWAGLVILFVPSFPFSLDT